MSYGNHSDFKQYRYITKTMNVAISYKENVNLILKKKATAVTVAFLFLAFETLKLQRFFCSKVDDIIGHHFGTFIFHKVKIDFRLGLTFLPSWFTLQFQ